MEYIAFLRGINVGGHTVRMERLRELFEALGLKDVRTYIQSGNVFFTAPAKNRTTLTLKIEAHLQKALGFKAPVFLRTIPEVDLLLASDPFKAIEKTPDTRFCVVFGEKSMPRSLSLPLYSPKKDAMIAGMTQAEAFVVWYIINGRPPAADQFLEKTLGQATTSRFFHTLAKIAEAAKTKR